MYRLVILLVLLATSAVAGCTPDEDASFVGAKGDPGDAGSPGPLGAKGERGPVGEHGALGAVGPVGPAGQDGVDGNKGPAGVAGPVGPMGVAGPPGSQGQPGVAGPVGSNGPAGPAGADGVPKSKADVYSVTAATLLPANGQGQAVVSCADANDILMLGGCEQDPFAQVTAFYGVNNIGFPSAWVCKASNQSNLSGVIYVTAHASCIAVP